VLSGADGSSMINNLTFRETAFDIATQIFYKRSGIYLHPKAIKYLFCFGTHLLHVDEHAACDFFSEKNVFSNREIWDEVELLVNRSDTEIEERFMRGKTGVNNTLELYLTAIRLNCSGQYLYQCRLARSVFTDDRMDLPPPEVDTHLIKCPDARVTLCHIPYR
jgi:hypothetical protein